MMVTLNAMIQEDVIDQLLLVMDMPPAVMDMMKQIVVMNVIIICTHLIMFIADTRRHFGLPSLTFHLVHCSYENFLFRAI